MGLILITKITITVYIVSELIIENWSEVIASVESSNSDDIEYGYDVSVWLSLKG